MDEKLEEALRNEAVNRLLRGEQPCDVFRALGRSRSWLHKWWTRFRKGGRETLKSLSRAPHRVHNKMALEVEEAIERIRKILVERRDPALKYAFIGAETIQGELRLLGYDPPPSVSAINRALRRRNLTLPRRKRAKRDEPTSHYPKPVANGPNAVHAMDIVERRIRGYGRICSFHLLDLARHWPVIRQYINKSAESAKSFLVTVWQTVGLPRLLQMDNEATFCGGYRGKRVISQIVRLCLAVGVEVLFIPFYSPKKNADVESFNGKWDQAFWQRERFTDLEHVQRESPIFEHWYRTRYWPAALEGRTPAESYPEFEPRLLPNDFALHQVKKLPITAGRIHFIREVNNKGEITILNETWRAKQDSADEENLAGEYVWATAFTKEQKLRIYHQADAESKRVLVAEYDYPLSEPVCDLAPSYRLGE